jgi:hypothetical protein
MDYREHPQEINVASCSKLKTEITTDHFGSHSINTIKHIQTDILALREW